MPQLTQRSGTQGNLRIQTETGLRLKLRQKLKPKHTLPSVFVVLTLAVLSGCASARMGDTGVDNAFREGKYDEAVLKLEEGLKKQGESGRDLLLYLLDLGLTYHTLGRYEDSNRIFARADKIAEIKDYTSLSAETASLLTSQNAVDYKGEDFEKVMINTYAAMNYALMGDYENALVEARVVNRKLYMMVTEGQRKYQQNAFARYLSGVIYEADGNWNDAYVEYKKVRELVPEYPGLGSDLWRMAYLLGMPDEMERWDDEFKLTRADHDQLKKTYGRGKKSEIVVLYENGISPIKRPNPNFRTIPKFYSRPNPVSLAHVELEGKVVADTAVLHNVETTAIENLDEKYAGIIAKRVAGIVTKEVVANQIEERSSSPLLGGLARLAMYASDQADTRSWNLLPRDLQVARIPVEPGTYTVKLLLDGGGELSPRVIQVGKGKKVFVNFRYMP